jgi:hypothetical protein
MSRLEQIRFLILEIEDEIEKVSASDDYRPFFKMALIARLYQNLTDVRKLEEMELEVRGSKIDYLVQEVSALNSKFEINLN